MSYNLQYFVKVGRPQNQYTLITTVTLRLTALDHTNFMVQPSDEVQGPSESRPLALVQSGPSHEMLNIWESSSKCKYKLIPVV